MLFQGVALHHRAWLENAKLFDEQKQSKKQQRKTTVINLNGQETKLNCENKKMKG